MIVLVFFSFSKLLKHIKNRESSAERKTKSQDYWAMISKVVVFMAFQKEEYFLTVLSTLKDLVKKTMTEF